MAGYEDSMDELTLLLLVSVALVPISVAAHMSVAYRFAPPLAIRRLKEWFRSPDGQETMAESVKTHVLPALLKEVGTADLRPWLSEKLVPQVAEVAATYVNEAAPKIVDAAFAKITASLEGVAGNAAKAADKQSGRELMTELAALDLGHPLLNGLWSYAVRTNGPAVVQKVGRVARRIASKADERFGTDLASAFDAGDGSYEHGTFG